MGDVGGGCGRLAHSRATHALIGLAPLNTGWAARGLRRWARDCEEGGLVSPAQHEGHAPQARAQSVAERRLHHAHRVSGDGDVPRLNTRNASAAVSSRLPLSSLALWLATLDVHSGWLPPRAAAHDACKEQWHGNCTGIRGAGATHLLAAGERAGNARQRRCQRVQQLLVRGASQRMRQRHGCLQLTRLQPPLSSQVRF